MVSGADPDLNEVQRPYCKLRYLSRKQRSIGQRVLCLMALTDGFVPQGLHSILPV